MYTMHFLNVSVKFPVTQMMCIQCQVYNIIHLVLKRMFSAVAYDGYSRVCLLSMSCSQDVM